MAISTLPTTTPVPQPPVATPRNATGTHHPPATEVAAETRTQNQGGQELSAADIRQNLAQRRATDTQVDRMLAPTGSGAPTAEDKEKIQAELSRVNPAVLTSLADSNLKIHVLGTGDKLLETGLLKEVDPAARQANLPQDKNAANSALATTSNEYDTRVKTAQETAERLQQEAQEQPPTQGGGGVFGSLGPNPKQEAANEAFQEAQELGQERRLAQVKTVNEATGDRWTVFSPGLTEKPEETPVGPPGMAGMIAQQKAHMLRQPMTLDQMAAHHGLTDPADIAKFKAQVTEMNGDRLNEARMPLNYLKSQAEGNGPEAEQAKKLLAQYEANPDQIPIDHANHPILVPNQYRYSFEEDGQQRTVNLSAHDLGTFKDWTGGTNRVKEGSTVGQYFSQNNSNDLLVRREVLGTEHGTLTHEVGHAVDHLYKKKDPEGYKDFHARLKAAEDGAAMPAGTSIVDQMFLTGDVTHNHAHTDTSRQAISTYAKANESEYFAEGFRVFHQDPDMLSSKDKLLFDLVNEANTAVTR